MSTLAEKMADEHAERAVEYYEADLETARRSFLAGWERAMEARLEPVSRELAKAVLDSVWTDAYNAALRYQQDMAAAKEMALTHVAGNLEYLLVEHASK